MANIKPVKLGNNVRMSFAKINEVLDMPNLLEVQKNSYQWFLDKGLQEVFDDMASITDYTGNLVLEFVGYRLDEETKYTVEQCKERDVTYAARCGCVPGCSIKRPARSKSPRYSWATSP